MLIPIISKFNLRLSVKVAIIEYNDPLHYVTAHGATSLRYLGSRLTLRTTSIHFLLFLVCIPQTAGGKTLVSFKINFE